MSFLTEVKPLLPSPKVPGLFNLSDENRLKNSFIKSRFRVVNVERVSVTFEFGSAETYTTCILETSTSRITLSFIELVIIAHGTGVRSVSKEMGSSSPEI